MKKIKALREAKGLTQRYIADFFGVTQVAVARWESGDAMPSADKLPRLAQLLGCTIDELYDTTSEE